MARDIQSNVRQMLGSESAREIIGNAVGEAVKSIGSDRSRSSHGSRRRNSHQPLFGSKRGPLSGAKGLVAGAGAAALAPVAARGVGKLLKGGGAEAITSAPKKAVEGATSKVGDTVSGKVGQKIDQAGGPSGILKDAVKSALPFGGGGGGPKGGVPGVGKGRRMPIQQGVNVAVPIETAYNQWTQFELWPQFMHRVTRVTQKDDCTISFAAKIWGRTKEFTAQIETQRPDERIKWRVSHGITHTGVVTFHELGPRLTRIELGLGVEPGGMLEKAARGMRHIKRAARADLHRFKAYIEMQERETGAWRGVIEDGKVVKEHDERYDKQREYSEFEDIFPDSDERSHSNGSDPEKKSERKQTGGRRSGERSQKSSSSGSASKRRASSRSSNGKSRTSSASPRASSSSSGRSSGSSRQRSRSAGQAGRQRASSSRRS